MRFGGKSHYDDVIMGAMASQVTSLTIVYSTVYSGSNQRKHQSSASLAFVRGIHRCFHLMTSSCYRLVNRGPGSSLRTAMNKLELLIYISSTDTMIL